jgi:FtsZ-binding cell division protein ZapB
MLGLHKRDMDKLEEENNNLKEEHSKWLNRQQQETSDWQA